MMSDTDGHTDHIAGLRKFADHLRDQDDRPMFAAAIDMHIDALAAENAALRAYARAVTARCDEYIVRTSDLQAEHGVAAILADD